MVKKVTEEIEFQLEDDEMGDDPFVEIIRKPKQTIKPRGRPPTTHNGPSTVIAARLPTKMIEDLEKQGVDVAAAFKEFCAEHLHTKTCPACGQIVNKKKQA